jgi:hypothetical protein
VVGAGVGAGDEGAGVCAPATSAKVIAAPAINRMMTVVLEFIGTNPPEKGCELRETQ